MSTPRRARRGLAVAVPLLALGLGLAPGPTAAAPVRAAAEVTVELSVTEAMPGDAVTVTGSAPGCGGQPFSLTQLYTNPQGSRSSTSTSGLATADGSFQVAVTVPAEAARSDLFPPLGPPQYDTVTARFRTCGDVRGATNLTVLPVGRDLTITVDPSQPVSGQTARFTATGCLGGVIVNQLIFVDGNGVRFPVTGTYTGSTLTGTIDLSDGNHGSPEVAGAGPATPSRPAGYRDAALVVPCAQSEGRVADVQYLSTSVLDLTVRAPGQPLTPPPPDSAFPFPGRVPASAGGPTGAAPTTTTVPEAAPARPVPGEARYAG